MKYKRRGLFRIFLGLFFILMAGAGLAAPSFAERLPSLFQAAPKGALGDLAVSVSQDQILASVDFSLLSGETAPKRMQVALPGRTVVIKKTRIVQRGENDYSWFGKVEGFRLNDVVFTVVGGVLVGRLNLDGEIYSLDPKNGFSLVTRNDESLAVSPGDDYLVPLISAGAPRKAEKAPPALGAANDGSVIDIMVLYTQAFATKYASSLSATIQAMVDIANTAYTNSGVNTQVNLVHSELFTDSTVSESNAISAALPNFTALSSVATLRSTYKADLVTLFRVYDSSLYGSSSCGLAYMMNRTAVSSSFSPYGFSVVEVLRASEAGAGVSYCRDTTLVHEMGHNMGCAHDRANYTSCNESSPDWYCPAYAYSYGYGISGTFGTIMSYISPRIEYFSTPSKTYSGYALGIGAGAADAADCVSTINNTTPIIAQFQLGTTTSVPVSLSAPTGLSATASGSTVSLSWSAVSGAAGYKLYYGTSSGAYSSSADLGNVTSQSFTGVSSGTYYLAITAYNSSSSESAKSTETSVTVSQLSAPAMTITVSGLNVTVSWNSVSGATGYTLYYAPYPSYTSIESMDRGSQTSLSVTLSSGAAYYVAVEAYNATQSSGYSNIGYFVLSN